MDELIVRLYQKITGHKKIHAHIQIFYNMCLCACTSKKKFLNPFYHLLLVFLLLPFTIPLLRLLPKSQCFSFHTGIDFFSKVPFTTTHLLLQSYSGHHYYTLLYNQCGMLPFSSSIVSFSSVKILCFMPVRSQKLPLHYSYNH